MQPSGRLLCCRGHSAARYGGSRRRRRAVRDAAAEAADEEEKIVELRPQTRYLRVPGGELAAESVVRHLELPDLPARDGAEKRRGDELCLNGVR